MGETKEKDAKLYTEDTRKNVSDALKEAEVILSNEKENLGSTVLDEVQKRQNIYFAQL